MIGCTPLAKQASLNGIAAVKAVAVGQRDRRKAELRRALGDRLGLHRPFEHGEGGKDAKRDERLSHARTMGSGARVRKATGADLSTDLSRRLPAAFHDVADLAHAADIGVADALPVRAAVAIAEEAVARSGAAASRCSGDAAASARPILRGHVAIERGKPGVGADRDLALACARWRNRSSAVPGQAGCGPAAALAARRSRRHRARLLRRDRVRLGVGGRLRRRLARRAPASRAA